MAENDTRLETLEDEVKVLKGEVKRTLVDLRALLMREDSPLAEGGFSRRAPAPEPPAPKKEVPEVVTEVVAPTPEVQPEPTTSVTTSGTMELKGSVVANATLAGSGGKVKTITFHVANAAAGEAIDLSQGNTIIRYTDKSQTANLNTSTEFSISDMGTGDSDELLERGEVFEIQILAMDTGTDTDIDTQLGVDTEFTLEVIPPKGAVLYIQRTTPVSFDLFTLLN